MNSPSLILFNKDKNILKTIVENKITLQARTGTWVIKSTNSKKIAPCKIFRQHKGTWRSWKTPSLPHLSNTTTESHLLDFPDSKPSKDNNINKPNETHIINSPNQIIPDEENAS